MALPSANRHLEPEPAAQTVRGQFGSLFSDAEETQNQLQGMDIVLTGESVAFCGACAGGCAALTHWLFSRLFSKPAHRPAQKTRRDDDAIEMQDLLPSDGESHSREGRRRKPGVTWAHQLCGSIVHEGPWLDILYLLNRTPETIPPEMLLYSSHRLCRVELLRCLGFVWAFAFLCVAFQARTLIGENGLTPIQCGEDGCALADAIGLDRALEMLGWTGFILGALQFLGLDSMLVSAAQYFLYLTFYRMARHASGFFHYGWDFQILETGFLAIFLSAPFCHEDGTPSSIIVWLFRIQSFRLMLGAGRSKIMASEPCWKLDKLDCMAYHYETTGTLLQHHQCCGDWSQSINAHKIVWHAQ